MSRRACAEMSVTIPSVLREIGQPVDDLQQVLQALENLSEESVYTDPSELVQIHSDMLDQLKRIEFGLRRAVEGNTSEGLATLSGADEVPDGYRTLVEEYYRSLARGEAGGNR